jgi:hypothetical protein
MCALICGDIHGNYTKAKAFLEYRPEEIHIFTGDYMDSYSATTDQILETFKMIMESDAVTLCGNHELHYLPNAHGYFKCSGFRDYTPSLVHAVGAFKDKLVAAITVDNYLITHGGLSKHHGKPFDNIGDAAEWINSEFNWYKNNPVIPEALSPIFNIGAIRGGRDQAGGPFWCSIGHEKMDIRFNQCVGHTPRSEPFKMFVGKQANEKIHVGIDCPLFSCFNTKTELFEDFMSEKYKEDHQMRKILERTF